MIFSFLANTACLLAKLATVFVDKVIHWVFWTKCFQYCIITQQ